MLLTPKNIEVCNKIFVVMGSYFIKAPEAINGRVEALLSSLQQLRFFAKDSKKKFKLLEV